MTVLHSTPAGAVRWRHDTLGEERLYAAYGDTEAGIPMLLSDRPVAGYPDKTPKATAKALKWTILD